MDALVSLIIPVYKVEAYLGSTEWLEHLEISEK